MDEGLNAPTPGPLKGRSALGLQWGGPPGPGAAWGHPMLPQDSVSWAWYRVPCCVTAGQNGFKRVVPRAGPP